MRTIIEIRNYDFELPSDHQVVVNESTVTLEDGGRASAYGLISDLANGERRVILNPDTPEKVGVGGQYLLPLATEELNRLLKLWDARFGDRLEYTRLRTDLDSETKDDWRPLFKALRERLDLP